MRRLLNWLLTGLRLLPALFMMSCAVVATRAGCGGNRAVTPLPQVSAAWIRRHDDKAAEAKRRAGQVDLLFVGDSITQNYENSDANPEFNFRAVWDEFFAPHGAMNLGFNADKSYNVLWRLRHGEADGLAPRDIVVLIGTNNFFPTAMEPKGETPDQVSVGILTVVDELHRMMPAARMLVLSILPTGYGTERNAMAEAVNAQVRAGVAKLEYARYLDVSGIFLDGKRVRDDLFYDGRVVPPTPSIHPTAQAQRLMAQAVAKALYGP